MSTLLRVGVCITFILPYITNIQALVCPTGWNTINGKRCVKVFTVDKTHQEATDLCQVFESELLTAGQKLDHMADDISSIAWDVTQVLLGLTDPWDTYLYQWTDGSLSDNLIWADDNPSEVGRGCVVFRTSQKDIVNVNCTDPNAFVCQKIRGNSECLLNYLYPGLSGCYESWDFISFLSSTEPVKTTTLTLQVCVQVCRGRGNTLASVWRGDCYCFTHSNMGTVMRVGSDKCNQPCPGNKNQLCGDKDGQYVSVLDMANYQDIVTSCMSLYNQGVRVPGPYLLLQGEDPTPSTRTCYYTDFESKADLRLPYSPEDWVYWNGNFYWFHVTTDSTLDVNNELCFNAGGGYLASVLSREELNFIESTIRGSPHLAPVHEWLVGLTDVSKSVYLRWSGPVLFDNSPTFLNTCTVSGPCCVVFSSEDGIILKDCSQQSDTVSGIICKQAHDFRGCRKLDSLASLPSMSRFSSSDMSALLCKELCRGVGAEFAVVMREQCYCEQFITETADLVEPHWCNTTCPGHSQQMCSGPGRSLWYSVEGKHVEELATDCNQLLFNGVSMAATYLISTDTHPFVTYSPCDFNALETSPSVPDSQITSIGIQTTPSLVDASQMSLSIDLSLLPNVGGLHTDSGLQSTSFSQMYVQVSTLPPVSHLESTLVSPMFLSFLSSYAADVSTSKHVSLVSETQLPLMTSSLSPLSSPFHSSHVEADSNSKHVSETLLYQETLLVLSKVASSIAEESTHPVHSTSNDQTISEASKGHVTEVIATRKFIHPNDILTTMTTLFVKTVELSPTSVQSVTLQLTEESNQSSSMASLPGVLEPKATVVNPRSYTVDPTHSMESESGSPLAVSTVDNVSSITDPEASNMVTLESSFPPSSANLEHSSPTESVQDQMPSVSSTDVASSTFYHTGSYNSSCKGRFSGIEAPHCPCMYLLTNAKSSTCKAAENTTVVLGCRSGWSFPEGHSNMTVECGQEGKWMPHPQMCVPGGQITSSFACSHKQLSPTSNLQDFPSVGDYKGAVSLKKQVHLDVSVTTGVTMLPLQEDAVLDFLTPAQDSFCRRIKKIQLTLPIHGNCISFRFFNITFPSSYRFLADDSLSGYGQ